VIKTAIFVEGQTELVFIREYLLKMFDYQNIWLECYTLFADNNFNTTEYSFPNDTASHYFQIINVGNDNAVLSKLLKREQHLWNNGFHKIFGIRDMYSLQYREVVQNATISEGVNLKFTETARHTIDTLAEKAENNHFHFAIMETEAWQLGLKNCFTYLYRDLNTAFIAEKLGINLDQTDPEKTFFHPAAIIEDIYWLANREYNKSKGDINAIMGNVRKDDFIELSQSDKCRSFNNFHNSILTT
jgi:hypothetical protein